MRIVLQYLIPIVLLISIGSPAWSAMVEKPIRYEQDGVIFESILIYDDAVTTSRPTVLMVPNWKGVTKPSVEKARMIAGSDYVVMVTDMYGVNIRPTNSKEAGEAAGILKKDRKLMRSRANMALDRLIESGGTVGADPKRISAIGFCFGGTTVLELARSGRAIDGVVSFHGNLDTPNMADAKNIKANILVLHGADDPIVPDQEIEAFMKEMKAQSQVDWQFVSFSGAVHSFTNPYAKRVGRAHYNKKVAKRAFGMMRNFFDELFDK
jgi:dienelactone hydrolase